MLRISWASLGKLEKGTPLGGSSAAGPIRAAVSVGARLIGFATGDTGYKAWRIPKGKWP